MSIFENLTDEQVEKMLKELLAKGYTEEQVFTEIYSKDCQSDEGEKEN